MDQLECRTPGGNHEVQNEPEPDLEPEFETPVNPRRVPCQNHFHEPNPRRPQQDHFCEPNPRGPNHEQAHEPNPRRLYLEPTYEPNVRRPTPIQLDQDDRAIKNVRLEAPTFDGILDPKIYIDWEGEMDQYFDWYDMTEERKCKFAKLRLIGQDRLY